MLILAAFLVAFWLLLVGIDVPSFSIGLVFILLALGVSIFVSSLTETNDVKAKIKLQRLPAFLLFFAHQSIKGGLDTAIRAFRPRLNIKPTFLHYEIKYVPPGKTMNLLMSLISLLPGSVSVIREPTSVLVHMLAQTPNSINDLRECEIAVCKLYGITLSDPQNGVRQ